MNLKVAIVEVNYTKCVSLCRCKVQNKCNVQTISRETKHVLISYNMDNTKLEHCTQEQDLGVWISLTRSNHSQASSKNKQYSAWIHEKALPAKALTPSPPDVHHHHQTYIITTTCTSSPAHVHHTYITTTTCTSPPPDVHLPGNCPFPSWICDADLGRRASKNRTDQNYGWHGWRMRLARCLSALNSRLSPIGRGYSWMGDHLGIASC